MENNNYPQAKLDLSEILEYANSDVFTWINKGFLSNNYPCFKVMQKSETYIV